MVETNRCKIPEIGNRIWAVVKRSCHIIAIKPISENLNATFIKRSNDARNDLSLYLKAGVRIREFVGEESSEEPLSLPNLMENRPLTMTE